MCARHTGSRPRRWKTAWAALALAFAVSACGEGGRPEAERTAVTRVVPGTTDTTLVDFATSTSVAPATTSTPATAVLPTTSLAVFAGNYVGSTGGSGDALIKDDGSGRFDLPDLIACPSCSNASAPRATIDFKLSAAAATGSGSYRGTGVITAQSNPAAAAAIGAGPVGASFKATLTAAGGLTLGFLRSENVLLRTGEATAATSPATGARTDSGPDAFLSPSKNIGCRISASNVRCDIREREWQGPPKPASCNEDWGFALGVSGQDSAQFRCVGDTAIGGVTTMLAYGSIARRGSFECRSQEIAMECLNMDTGHGILLSRGEYKLS